MMHSAILTIEPISLGGVPTMVKAVDSLLRRWGHPPTLIYTDAESVPTDGLASLLRYYLQHPAPRRETRDGLDGLAIPLWPLPQWLGYYTPLVATRRALASADIRLVVAGSAHTGLPFTYNKRPFVLWVATLYADEIKARASVGDAWAGHLLSSRAWPRLMQQEQRVLERAAAVLALSPHTAESIRRLCPSAAERVQTLLCPIDTELFQPGERPPGERPIEEPFLLFTARLRDPRKNVTMLLKAFARVRLVYPGLKLVLIGDAPLEAHLALRRELGLAESVVFCPPLPREALVPYYRSAELFVLSSLQEGLGISFIEAMACGLPVVATRCGGPEGVVTPGETGWLVPNDDEQAFADAILGALSDPARLRAMRANCRQYAERELARPVVEAKLLAALRGVWPREFAPRPEAQG
jgi:glycosyltransferase involved in cell wall biosynthesis